MSRTRRNEYCPRFPIRTSTTTRTTPHHAYLLVARLLGRGTTSKQRTTTLLAGESDCSAISTHPRRLPRCLKSLSDGSRHPSLWHRHSATESLPVLQDGETVNTPDQSRAPCSRSTRPRSPTPPFATARQSLVKTAGHDHMTAPAGAGQPEQGPHVPEICSFRAQRSKPAGRCRGQDKAKLRADRADPRNRSKRSYWQTRAATGKQESPVEQTPPSPDPSSHGRAPGRFADTGHAKEMGSHSGRSHAGCILHQHPPGCSRHLHRPHKISHEAMSYPLEPHQQSGVPLWSTSDLRTMFPGPAEASAVPVPPPAKNPRRALPTEVRTFAKRYDGPKEFLEQGRGEERQGGGDGRVHLLVRATMGDPNKSILRRAMCWAASHTWCYCTFLWICRRGVTQRSEVMRQTFHPSWPREVPGDRAQRLLKERFRLVSG